MTQCPPGLRFTDSDTFYWEMVKKNIGIYTKEEQTRLKNARVVIFGLGGVGGYEAITRERQESLSRPGG